MNKVVCILIGRCSVWGKSYKRHWYSEEDTCYRCGITRKEAKND